jgi:N-dimethylarginine dimethylaminohydrolase
MVDPLRKVIVRRPGESFSQADPVFWHYAARPIPDRAVTEHDLLVDILISHGIEVINIPDDQDGLADSIYVHDPSIVSDVGAIILRMGKKLREGEEHLHIAAYKSCGVPVYYRLNGDARAEGGDLLWLDRNTLAVGVGFRTNNEGVRQLQEALSPVGVEVMPFELPYFHGPQACLHLMSLVSMIDHDLAVGYPYLMPVSFYQLLVARNIELIEVPREEFATMGPNVLALAPRICLALEGNPVTKQRLETSGCQVFTYSGDEISLKAEGGATCLTRPVLREY